MSTHRLFVAFPIELSESLQAALKRTRINAQKKEMEINWTPESNFHVTLNFLGQTDATRLVALESVLSEVASQLPPLSTDLRGMGAFPDERHMRVLWIGVRRSRALADLQETLRSALVAADFPQEEREYRPHLTVGRLRKSRSGTDLMSPYVRTAFGEVQIERIALYESVMHGQTPVYKIMNQFPLTGVAQADDLA